MLQGVPKNDPTCFCPNFVKSPPNLIIFCIQIAKTTEKCKVHSLSNSHNLCQRITMLTQMLQIVTLRGDYQYQSAHFFIINLTESAM